MNFKYLSPQVRNDEDKIRKVCNGDKAAESFCVALLVYINTIDDLFDKDKPVTVEQVAGSMLGLISNLAFNDFFIKHRESLYPLMVQGCSAWADSELMKSSKDPQIREATDVLKAYWGEIIFHIAFLCGGYDHMRRCSVEYRGFDFEEPPKQV